MAKNRKYYRTAYNEKQHVLPYLLHLVCFSKQLPFFFSSVDHLCCFCGDFHMYKYSCITVYHFFCFKGGVSISCCDH